MWYEPLWSIWSFVYISMPELLVSAHFKNNLNQDNLAGNTRVSFSALAWDSHCLWLVLNRQNNSSGFLSSPYFCFLSSPSFPFLCFLSMVLCFKWQFIPFVRSATLNINFLTEHTLRPNRRNKISAIYCVTPSSRSGAAMHHQHPHQSSPHPTTREQLHNNANAIRLPLKSFYTYCKTVTISRAFEFFQEPPGCIKHA